MQYHAFPAKRWNSAYDRQSSSAPLGSLYAGLHARALEKAKTLDADGIILDLEDAVAPGAKDAAREAGREPGYQLGYGFGSVNGQLLGRGEPIRVKQGERVLFHIVNASATDIHSLALPEHVFRVVALDGNLKLNSLIGRVLQPVFGLVDGGADHYSEGGESAGEKSADRQHHCRHWRALQLLCALQFR